MVLGATASEEFTELVTATMRKIYTELYDNVMKRHPLLDLLRSEQRSQNGRKLIVPLELAENNSTQLTDKSGSFDTTESDDIMGVAEYGWSNPIVSSVRLLWQDLQENSGKEQRINLLKAHLSNMEYSHGKELVNMLHARADQGEVKAGQFHSLDEVVSDEAYDTAQGLTVGGIDSSSQDKWQAQRIELPLDGSQSIRKAFRTVENEVLVATSNGAAIDHIVAGRDIFEEFVDSFDDKVRYTEFGDGQTKFREVEFGDLKVRLDPDCPPKRAYHLDKSTWEFKSLAGNFMSPQEAQQIPGTLDTVTPAASVLAVGVNERRANAVLLRPDTAGGDA